RPEGAVRGSRGSRPCISPRIRIRSARSGGLPWLSDHGLLRDPRRAVRDETAARRPSPVPSRIGGWHCRGKIEDGTTSSEAATSSLLYRLGEDRFTLLSCQGERITAGPGSGRGLSG